MTVHHKTNVELSKSKAFADILNVAKLLAFACHRPENIVGKGENADNQHFLHFPKCFLGSKTLVIVL